MLDRAIDVAALGMQWIRKQVRASTTRPSRCPKGAVRGGKALSMPPGFNRLQHLDALSRRKHGFKSRRGRQISQQLAGFYTLQWSTVKAVSPQKFNGSLNVKDDEFEGDEQAQTPMKGNVTAPCGRHASRHKIALEISLCLSTR
jgi:hypothetical protein